MNQSSSRSRAHMRFRDLLLLHYYYSPITAEIIIGLIEIDQNVQLVTENCKFHKFSRSVALAWKKKNCQREECSTQELVFIFQCIFFFTLKEKSLVGIAQTPTLASGDDRQPSFLHRAYSIHFFLQRQTEDIRQRIYFA